MRLEEAQRITLDLSIFTISQLAKLYLVISLTKISDFDPLDEIYLIGLGNFGRDAWENALEAEGAK